MTQSDPSGQGGPARRASGRATSTETVAKHDDKHDDAASGSTDSSSAPTKDTGRDASKDTGKDTGNDTGRPASSGKGATRNGAAAVGAQRADARTGSPSSPLPGGATAGSEKTRPPARDEAARKPRRARLRLTQIDAWTVMKTSFLLSIALGIVSVVAVAVIWTVLGVAGVFDSMNDTVQTVLGNDFRLQDYIGTGRILGFTMIVAVVDVVLLTAIATLAAFLYNLAATLLGGVEVTLTEDR